MQSTNLQTNECTTPTCQSSKNLIKMWGFLKYTVISSKRKIKGQKDFLIHPFIQMSTYWGATTSQIYFAGNINFKKQNKKLHPCPGGMAIFTGRESRWFQQNKYLKVWNSGSQIVGHWSEPSPASLPDSSNAAPPKPTEWRPEWAGMSANLQVLPKCTPVGELWACSAETNSAEFCHLLAVWPWSSHMTSLCFDFLMHRPGMKISPGILLVTEPYYSLMLILTVMGLGI